MKMKNIVKSLFTIALAVFAAASCDLLPTEKEHAEGLRVTYYPDIVLTGGNTIAWQVGETYVDPGYKATLQGNDVTGDVVVSGEVDGSESAVYTLTYSYENEDGFVSTATRTVVVYDVASASQVDISGKYSNTNTTTMKPDGSIVRNWNTYAGYNYAINITKGPATGLFYIQDLYTGFYLYYYNYGSAYAYKAFVLLNADNTINILNGDEIDPWGDPVSDYPGVDSYYDAATGDVVINWLWGYYGDAYIFRSTYKK